MQLDLFEGGRAPRVLVACEYSGIVRNAFLARGFDAWSCDLLSSEDGSNRHITGDARALLGDGWDMLMVAQLARRFRCTKCGWSARSTRPDWTDRSGTVARR